MHVILLSNNFGRKLWPLTNDSRLEQFIKLLKTYDEKPESAIQRIYRQLQSTQGFESITIVASLSQKEQLETQLGKEVDIVYQTENHGEFFAIALACVYLYSEKEIDSSGNILCIPADTLVEDDFFAELLKSEDELSLPKGVVNRFCRVDDESFQPKLSCIQIGDVFSILKTEFQICEFDYANIEKAITRFEKEKPNNIVFYNKEIINNLKFTENVKKIESWHEYSNELSLTTGYVIADQSCSNTHIINEQSIPVMAIGVQDIVIAVSYSGILVANKEQTHKVEELASQLSVRPMCEERRWGSYIILSRSKDEECESIIKKILINEGAQISYQYHNCRKEIWTIVSGRGLLYLEGERREVYPGDTVVIEIGMKHGLKALRPLEMVEVQLGSNLVEEDIVRLDYNWS